MNGRVVEGDVGNGKQFVEILRCFPLVAYVGSVVDEVKFFFNTYVICMEILMDHD